MKSMERKIFNIQELEYDSYKGMFKVPDYFWSSTDDRWYCQIVFRHATSLERCV